MLHDFRVILGKRLYLLCKFRLEMGLLVFKLRNMSPSSEAELEKKRQLKITTDVNSKADLYFYLYKFPSVLCNIFLFRVKGNRKLLIVSKVHKTYKFWRIKGQMNLYAVKKKLSMYELKSKFVFYMHYSSYKWELRRMEKGI